MHCWITYDPRTMDSVTRCGLIITNKILVRYKPQLLKELHIWHHTHDYGVQCVVIPEEAKPIYYTMLGRRR